MAPGRTVLESLGADAVTIPFWLRAAGVAVGAAVAVLVVISAFTAGPPARTRFHAAVPLTEPAVPRTPSRAQRTETAPASGATPADLPGLPAPLTSGQFRDPAAVAAAFATAYLTWISPDGPPGSAARVEPYITADLFAHFPEPTSWPAPSALAAIDGVTVAAPQLEMPSPQTRPASVSLTQHLLGQDGRPIGAPQAHTLSVTLEQQPSGDWLVGRFTPG
jgi:hypothetical protein